MNKTTDKTKTPQQTKTGEQTPEAAPAPTETETQLTMTEGPPTETPLVTEKPKTKGDREYTRNVEETNLSLLIHNPRLYSELSHYFKAGLFVEKPNAQLWKLMARGKVEEFALQEAINRSKLDEPEKQGLRALLGRIFKSPQPLIYEDAFRHLKDWLVRATWDDMINEPFQNVGPIIERLSAVSLAATGRNPILDLRKPDWADVVDDILSTEQCVPFAFPEHNTEGGGLPKGSVAVFPGASHCGKSKLAFYAAVFAALAGHSVLILDFENNRRSSRRNLVACLSHTPWREIARMAERERTELLAKLEALPLELVNPVGSGDASRAGIRRLLIDYRNRHKKFPDLLIVDQLGKLDAGLKNASLHETGEARIMALQAIAKQFDLVVMVPHHINREGQKEAAKGKGTNELSIAGSQKIFDWADFIFILDSPFDDRDVDDPVLRDFICMKIRNRKARDERRLPTLYFEVDPARYIFKPITRETYMTEEAKIAQAPDKQTDRQEAKRGQGGGDGDSPSVFAAAEKTREAAEKKRKKSAGIVVAN
jgi:hypothetical protein